MKHDEYERIIPGAQAAVLFIHGILGTPRHFDDLVKLVPQEWSVCNLLLPGHGGSVRDFSASSMESWQSCVKEKMEALLIDHKAIYIVAHSMGTLLALRQAYMYPESVKGVFLLAVPLKIRIRPQMIISAGKVYLNRISPEDKIAAAARDSCSIRNDKRIWMYLGWIPRYLELFREIRNTRALLKNIPVPGVAFQSRRDEMVSMKAAQMLKEQTDVCVEVLASSMHYYYEESDYQKILQRFGRFIQK